MKKIFIFSAICSVLFCLLTGCQKAETPQPTPAPTLSEEALLDQRLNEQIAAMPLNEKVGQLFFVRCPDVDATGTLEQYQFGGYLLFGRDFDGQTPESVRATLQSYQSVCKIPALIGVDEEGGDVCRISQYPAFRQKPFPAPQALIKSGGLSAVEKDTAEKSDLLTNLGINVNFAPVCDLSANPKDFIYDRTTGQDAAATADYVKTVVKTMQTHHIGSVLKHFPGYGPNADTHKGLSVDNRLLEQLSTNDIIPFQAGIDAGADSILVSHNVVTCLDNALPASLSPAVHQYLRESCHFDGVILTDDLDMAAIRENFPGTDAAIKAILAGNDMIVTSQYETEIPAVIDAVKKGVISEKQIDASVKRVLLWKEKLNQ